MNFSIVFSDSYDDISVVHDELYEFNLSRTGKERVAVQANMFETSGALIVRGSDDNKIYGGVVWHKKPEKPDEISVDYMFLNKVLRGTGKGRELFELMEKRVKSEGATAITVTTNSFQAPWFYTALGYKETRRIAEPQPNIPDNIHFAYRKEL